MHDVSDAGQSSRVYTIQHLLKEVEADGKTYSRFARVQETAFILFTLGAAGASIVAAFFVAHGIKAEDTTWVAILAAVPGAWAILNGVLRLSHWSVYNEGISIGMEEIRDKIRVGDPSYNLKQAMDERSALRKKGYEDAQKILTEIQISKAQHGTTNR